MVWIVEWTQPGQHASNVTLWPSEQEALASACSDIMADIKENWDLGDGETNDMAVRISDECAAMNFREAISLYNDWESEGYNFEWMQQYSVYEREIHTTVPPIQLLKPLGTTTIPAPPSSPPFVPTSEGATCRGPCKSYNEYASADSPDGTYCCYQCKMMGQVFS